jgi:catalase
MFRDFLSLTPESIHQVTFLFSDRGTTASYRNMNGYSSHSFKWCNDKGEYFWVQYHFKTDQGIKNLTPEQAGEFPWDIFDITKVWPPAEVPPVKVGRRVLDRNPHKLLRRGGASRLLPRQSGNRYLSFPG